jgi:hypothetical protein
MNTSSGLGRIRGVVLDATIYQIKMNKIGVAKTRIFPSTS